MSLQEMDTNMLSHFVSPMHWLGFMQRIQLLGTNSSALRSSKTLTPEHLMQLTSDTRCILSQERRTSSQQKFRNANAFGPLASFAGLCHGASLSALWLPLDLVLEDVMDGYQVNATSGIEIITGKNATFILHSTYFCSCNGSIIACL